MLALLVAHALPARAAADPTPDTKAVDRERAIRCLTMAIAYEAGFEAIEGQRAVADVILNRAAHPAYPRSVCGVVFQGSTRKTGCQFTFTCDGSLQKRLPPVVLATARQVSVSALDDVLSLRMAGATHYHADYVSPYWAPSLIRIAKIGVHIFYRLPGNSDARTARYAPNGEPEIASLDQQQESTPQPSAATPRPAFTPWGLSPL